MDTNRLKTIAHIVHHSLTPDTLIKQHLYHLIDSLEQLKTQRYLGDLPSETEPRPSHRRP